MKTVLLFPGQGSHKNILRPEDKSLFDSIKNTLDVASKILGHKFALEQKTSFYKRSEIAQPAILAIGIGSYNWYTKHVGKPPDYLAGHSLGEITALTAAGSIGLEDALKLVSQRGKLMDEVGKLEAGSMLAINGVPIRELTHICKDLSSDKRCIEVANDNGHSQVVVSGHVEVIEKMKVLIDGFSKASAIPLSVNGAYHSSLMNPIKNEFSELLKLIKWEKPKIKVVSSVNTIIYKNTEQIVTNLNNQICNPVHWTNVVSKLFSLKVRRYFDMGPSNILTNLITRQLENYSKEKVYVNKAITKNQSFKEVLLELKKVQTEFINDLLINSISLPNNKGKDVSNEYNILIGLKNKNHFLHLIDIELAKTASDKIQSLKKIDRLL